MSITASAASSACKTIEAAGAPHDCLEIHYAAGDKLFLPVENIELLSRYGSEDAEVTLDRLGDSGWRERKARMKQAHPRDGAGPDTNRGRARRLHEAPQARRRRTGSTTNSAPASPMTRPKTSSRRSRPSLDDLASGRPMDRLICGDVGFGKTEVALRAAFAAAINGMQVAVVVPTTLLARQHYKNFAARFAGLPVRLAQMSRMVAGGGAARGRKEALADGSVDIVVGTHAVLGKTMSPSRTSASSSSTRSSISASATRSG